MITVLISILLVVVVIKLIWNAGVGVWMVWIHHTGKVSLMPYVEAAMLLLASMLVWANGGYFGLSGWYVLVVGLLAGFGSYLGMVVLAMTAKILLKPRHR